MKGNRNSRLNVEFKKEIYDIITSKLKNPYITEMFSIMDVVVSGDLKHAKVYVSVYSKNEEKKLLTFEEIKKSAKTIRYELSKTMKTRTVPELNFILDTTMDYSDKINKILNVIKTDDET